MFYSASTGGFYSRDIHGDIPADAVEIGVTAYKALLVGQASGKHIATGSDGFPVLSDPPPPTSEQLAEIIRAQRDRLLIVADKLVNIATDAGVDASSARAWRVALRDVPDQVGFPAAVAWPVVPSVFIPAAEKAVINSIID